MPIARPIAVAPTALKALGNSRVPAKWAQALKFQLAEKFADLTNVVAPEFGGK
jgi:hypothetical protein